jgi:hypothetical protein
MTVVKMRDKMQQIEMFNINVNSFEIINQRKFKQQMNLDMTEIIIVKIEASSETLEYTSKKWKRRAVILNLLQDR